MEARNAGTLWKGQPSLELWLGTDLHGVGFYCLHDAETIHTYMTERALNGEGGGWTSFLQGATVTECKMEAK